MPNQPHPTHARTVDHDPIYTRRRPHLISSHRWIARARERRLGTEPRAAHAHGARARARLDSVPIDRSIARAAVQAPTATARPYLHCSPTPTWRAYHTIRRHARPHYWDDATLQATGPRVGLKLTARIGFEKILNFSNKQTSRT